MFNIFSSPQEISLKLSHKIISLIRDKPHAVLGLATGSTMEPVYAELVRQRQLCAPDVSRLRTFNLDEYIGLPASHPQSYNHYMHQHFFNAFGLEDEQVCLPDGICCDVEAECTRYSAAIAAAGGLDFQLLGIGSNGHIGFNEPGTAFDSRTHVIELSANTRADNSRLFTDPAEMPTHAITMGIADIMSAREVVLVITGEHKADIVRRLFQSEANSALPASVLQLHPNAQIYLDEAAASQLPKNVGRRMG